MLPLEMGLIGLKISDSPSEKIVKFLTEGISVPAYENIGAFIRTTN